MKPVDSHCHLDFDRFKDDREEVIERAREELEFVVNAGSNLEHNRAALRLQDRFPDFIVANMGLHPTYTDHFNELSGIKQQIRRNEPAAIGEIGLDHYHVTDEEERRRQKSVFREMLELAEEMERPVVVHSRKAEAETVKVLSEYSVPVMLHCFNGGPELAEEAAEKGMKIGITTQVLYSPEVQETVDSIETGDMLLETDSPFLYRNGRNEPLNVVQSAEKIADIKEIDPREMVEATTSNARDFFL